MSQAVNRRTFIKATAGASTALLARSPASAGQTGAAARGSIDAHAHWVPQAYADALASLGRPTTSLHTPLELDRSLDQLIAWMDAHGLPIHVLPLDGGMPWQWVSPSDGLRLAQIVNDAAAAAHAK